MQIRHEGTNAEGRQRFTLEWNTASNALYRLDTLAAFNSNSAWTAFDLFQPTGSAFKVTLDGDPLKEEAAFREVSGFYRVYPPETVIFSIEPSVIAAGEATQLYLFGQCFDSNDVLRLQGPGGPWVLTNRTLINGNTVLVEVVPPSAGTYVFELVSASTGQTNIGPRVDVIAVSPGSTARSLLEPPREPVASPMFKTRHDTLKSSIGNIRARTILSGGNVGVNEPSPDVTLHTKKSSGLGQAGDAYEQHADAVAERAFNNWPGEIDVMPFSGEMQIRVVDMFVPGRGLDFIFARTYRSRTGTNSSMGFGWTHSYDIHLQPLGGDILIHGGDGRADRYRPDSNGVFAAEEIFNEGRFSNDIFVLTFPNGGKWIFNSLSNAVAPGKISRIEDRFGNALTFDYTASGWLSTIVDTLGRTNRIVVDMNRIFGVQDFTGRRVTYGFDAYTNLTSIQSPAITGTTNGNDFPNGKTMRYAYSTGFADEALNHNLLTITDAKNHVWFECVYDTTTNPADLAFDSVSDVIRGEDTTTIRREVTVHPAKIDLPNLRVMSAVIRDPIGNVSESYFDSRNRLVLHRAFTGRADTNVPATLAGNRPVNPLRTNDPAYFQTSVEWTADSLPSRITHPSGLVEKMVYRQDFGPVQPHKRGELRVKREVPCCGGGADTDGDGLDDLFERVWRYDYHPDFGSPALNMRERINQLEERLQSIGMLGRVRSITDKIEKLTLTASEMGQAPARMGNPLLNEAVIGLADSFVTAVTDPRGNVTTAEYDAQGNRVKVQFHWDRDGKAEVDFAYNSHGQLTAITNAPDGNDCRRVDEFEYYDTPGQPGHGFLKAKKKDTGNYYCGTSPHFLIDTSFEYDGAGNLIRIIDPRTNDWLFTYNALGQCVRKETAELRNNMGENYRIATQFTYDANDNLTVVEHQNLDHNGVKPAGQLPYWRTEFVYDALNRVTGCWRDKNGNLWLRCTSVSYDANDNIVLFRSGEAANGNDPHAEMQFFYDERNLPFCTIHAPSSLSPLVYDYAYTANGELSSVHWGSGTTKISYSTMEYDGFDRCIRRTDAMGNVDAYAYDANGNMKLHRVLAEQFDLAGSAGNLRYHEWRWTYDALNRMTGSRGALFIPATQAPLGDGERTTTFTYAPNSALLTETDDAGFTTRYEYDTAGRLSSVTDPKTNVVSYTYDANGNVTSITQHDRSDIDGSVRQFVQVVGHDPLNRPAYRSDHNGNNENWDFNSGGNIVRYTGPNGIITMQEFDGLNRKLKVFLDKNGDGTMSANELRSLMVWDDNDRLTSETDPNTNATTYVYDSRDRLQSVSSPDGTPHTFVWNAFSDLVSSTDANGTVISNSYDLKSRLVRRDISPAEGVAATTTFEVFAYDGMSRLVLASNDVSRIECSYDSAGNRDNLTTDGWQMLQAFDSRGDRTTIAYGIGNPLSFNALTYTFDALRRLSSVGSVFDRIPGPVATLAYEGPARLAGMARANGINTRFSWNGAVNPANAPGDFGWQQVSLVNHQVAGGAVIDQRISTYDHNQNKMLRQQLVPWGPLPALTTNVFGYDELNRLVSFERRRASTIATKSFQLDDNGNRLTATSNGVVSSYAMDGTLPQPADLQMSRYTMTPFDSRQYDLNGNLIGTLPLTPDGAPTQFTYDYANRLVEVTRISAIGTPELVASFAYDALGQRISKTVPGAGLPAALSVTTRYYRDLDSGCIIEERVNGLVVREHLPTADAGLDLILATRQQGTLLFLHSDEAGNVLAITDAAQNVLERYDYDEFGAPRFYAADGVPLGTNGIPNTSSYVGNAFLFHSMEWDSETGLYFGTRDGTPMIEWTFEKGWPCRYEGPRLDSESAGYFNPKSADFVSGRYVMRAGVPVRHTMAGGQDIDGGNPWTAKLVGKTKYPNIVLKRGYLSESSTSAKVHRDVLKSYFQSGDKPTQEQSRPRRGTCVNLNDEKEVIAIYDSAGRAFSSAPGRGVFHPPAPPAVQLRAREAIERGRLVNQGVLKARRHIERD